MITLNSGMERKQTKYASIPVFSLYFLIVVHENETKSHKQITMKVLPTIFEKQDNSFPATVTKAPNILTQNSQ